jgi:hypothetical protein
MSFPDFSKLSISELLVTYNMVMSELRYKEVIRTENNPTGDYAEWLVTQKLNLRLEKNSAAGYDAKDLDGNKYQIKGRRITPRNTSTQLGVIRNLDKKDFDFLIAVIFNENWEVQQAAKIPHASISAFSTYKKHQNGHVMHFREEIFKNDRVENIVDRLRS